MQNNSLYLPGFHLATLRRRPRSTAQKLADEIARIRRHSISQLGDCFGHFIPTKALANVSEGAFSRRRLFSKENTFWAFFSQILDADGGGPGGGAQGSSPCCETINARAVGLHVGVQQGAQQTRYSRTERNPLAHCRRSATARSKPLVERASRCRRRWHRSQHGRYARQPRYLASAQKPETGLWLSAGPNLCLLLTADRRIAELSDGAQQERRIALVAAAMGQFFSRRCFSRRQRILQLLRRLAVQATRR